MKFVFYESLNKAAKSAFNKGNGKHGKFAIDGDYIAVLENGRALDWVKVVRKHSKPIAAKN